MSKCLPFLRRRRKSNSLLACDRSQSPKETLRVESPQSADPVSEVIFTFQNGNCALNKKKQTMHAGTAENEEEPTSPKLLLPIVVVLGWKVDPDSNMKKRNLTPKGTEISFPYVLQVVFVLLPLLQIFLGCIAKRETRSLFANVKRC